MLPFKDETTSRNLLQRDQLIDGAYYVGRCRNATVARWNEADGQFYHWRQKFGDVFVETIKHPEDDLLFDVFRPVRLLEYPAFEIPFQCGAYWPSYSTDLKPLSEYDAEMWCSCHQRGTCIHCQEATHGD